MHIETLRLSNYRNYEAASAEFSKHVNVFLGENAQGKTNIMEAIYVLAMAKSHRTSNDKELIRWDAEYGKIKGDVHKKYGTVPFELTISQKGKKAKVNHLEQSRLSDYIGQMNVVMFAPEDLNLVKGSPQVRRRFLDMEIGQISPVYLHDLLQFQKILKQRNHILKQNQGKPSLDDVMFAIYTEQYVEAAVKVIAKRMQFIELLQSWAETIHHGISRGLEKLNIRYHCTAGIDFETTVDEWKQQLTDKLEKSQRTELQRGTTLYGPHRDDLQFFVNDYDVQTYGSQGQQRTTALSLKLAEIELIHQEVGEPPILLLDDVLSELDDYRQTHLLNTIQDKVQTFVTTTTVDGLTHDVVTQAKLFHVEHGTIQEKSHVE